MRTLARLAKRDVAFVGLAQSAAEKRFRNLVGWQFRCVLAHETHFQRDLAVSFPEDELASRKADDNFGRQASGQDAPGASLFCRNAAREVFDTYSMAVAWRW